MPRAYLIALLFLLYLIIGHWILSNLDYASGATGDAAGRGMSAGFTMLIVFGIFYTTLLFLSIASIMWAAYLKRISDTSFEYAYTLPLVFTVIYALYFMFMAGTSL